MRNGIWVAATLVAGIGAVAGAQAQDAAPQVRREIAAMKHAKGTFEVKVTPQDGGEDPKLGRMALDKQFHGNLEAAGKGQMLTAATNEQGSAGYVAIEKVSGTLDGRTGTFVLQHTGTMNRGKPELSVTVVPDSGTGELTGLAGKMAIIIESGKHSYDFEYTLAEK
jgi:hypothetical protein